MVNQILVEGWNEGWEDWFGNSKDYVFDFVTRRQWQYDQLYNRHHENYSQNGSVP
jgi:hypothetical protein